MKIHDLFLYVALVGIVATLIACSDDQGNYDYTALNEVLIDSIGLIHGQLTEKRCRRKKS